MMHFCIGPAAHDMFSSVTGVPSLWDLMPDDLRWSWCDNNRNKGRNKRNALESSRTISHPWSVEKLSSTKPVPHAKKVGDRCSVRQRPTRWSPFSVLFASISWAVGLSLARGRSSVKICEMKGRPYKAQNSCQTKMRKRREEIFWTFLPLGEMRWKRKSGRGQKDHAGTSHSHS